MVKQAGEAKQSKRTMLTGSGRPEQQPLLPAKQDDGKKQEEVA